MIVEQMVPEIYYDNSRDFAYIGRLLEIIFNYMKTAADNVGVEPNEDIDSNIIDLLVNTLGFESKHEYITKDLVYVASSFAEILRNKGSFYAIELAIQTLLNSQRIRIKFIDNLYDYDTDRKELTIYLPVEMVDTVLLDDIMDYILPAGVIYKYVKVLTYKRDDATKSIVGMSDTIEHHENKFTTRLHNIEDLVNPADPDAHLGTIYTGTSIDSVIAPGE